MTGAEPNQGPAGFLEEVTAGSELKKWKLNVEEYRGRESGLLL